IKTPETSSEQLAVHFEMVSEHLKLNDQFVIDYFDDWSSRFSGFSIQKIYNTFRYKGYKISAYRRLSAELGGKEELLKFLLVSCKKNALRYMGYSENEIKNVLKPYNECGSYMV